MPESWGVGVVGWRWYVLEMVKQEEFHCVCFMWLLFPVPVCCGCDAADIRAASSGHSLVLNKHLGWGSGGGAVQDLDCRKS